MSFLALLAGATLFPALPAVAQSSLGGRPWNVRDQVNFSVFQTGTQSKIKNQALIEIQTENDFQVYWLNSTGQSPQSAPRGIDWLREKLVAVHLGERPTGGYSIFVQNIQRRAGTNYVLAQERKPWRGQYVSEAVTQPWVLLKVERNAARFQLQVSDANERGVPGGQIIITDPGTVIVNPNDFDRSGGGGYIDPRNAVDWDVCLSGTYARSRPAQTVLLDNSTQWSLHWAGLTGRPFSQAPRVPIDWTKERLVALHLGTRRTGGYGIRVVSVERDGLTGIIRAVEETPVPGSVVTDAVTSPWTVIRVPRALINFRLDLRQRQGGPGDVKIID